MRYESLRSRLAGLTLAVAVAAVPGTATGQDRSGASPAAERTTLGAPADASSPDVRFDHMLQRFHATYKIGPEDELAVRVVGEPDFSLERVQVSPFGNVYHPLLGDVAVAGLTVPQATEKLREALSEFIISPRVSVALLAAHSAKVGVIGDVTQPGIVTMVRPMSVLDGISAAGGFTSFGAKSNVTVLRQLGGGQTRTIEVNVKRILEGKADPYENIALQPGDTVVVHGNKLKTLATITSLTGFASFVSFIGR